MRTLRLVVAALVLTVMFGMTSIAGEISTGVASPQPAPTSAPAQGEITTGLNGNIHTGVAGDIHTTEATAETVVAGALVDLVQGVLALL